MRPATIPLEMYREATGSFAFILNDTAGQPFDMNLLGEISMRVFTAEGEPTPIFVPPLSVSDNVISGELTDIQTVQTRGSTYWYEIRTTYLGKSVFLFNGPVTTLDATSGKGTTDDIVEAVVDLVGLAVTATLGDSASIALQAKADAETARDLSQEYASNPEDVPVTTNPDVFSSLHWAAKSQTSAQTIQPVADKINQALSGLLHVVQEDELFIEFVPLEGAVVTAQEELVTIPWGADITVEFLTFEQAIVGG